MKLLLFCWAIVNTSLLFSQSIQGLINEILVDKSGYLQLKTNVDLEYSFDMYNDSLWIPTLESDVVFNLSGNSHTSRYYRKDIYQLPSGNRLRIDVILDTIILLEERIGNKIVRAGEVRIDTTNFITYKLPNAVNIHGDDSLVVDTFYMVIPVNYWYSDVDGLRVESGTFKNGQKDDVWEVSLWLGADQCLETVIEEQLFDKGKLVSLKTIGHLKPTDKIFVNRLLTKEWLGTRCFDFEADGSYFYGFKTTRESVGPKVSLLDYLNISEDGTYTEKSYHWCGTCSRKSIESKWYLEDNNELFLNGYQYFIEYISETELLLEVCPNSE